MTFDVSEQGPAGVVAEAVGEQLAARAQDVGQSPVLNALAQATRACAADAGGDTVVAVEAHGSIAAPADGAPAAGAVTFSFTVVEGV